METTPELPSSEPEPDDFFIEPISMALYDAVATVYAVFMCSMAIGLAMISVPSDYYRQHPVFQGLMLYLFVIGIVVQVYCFGSNYFYGNDETLQSIELRPYGNKLYRVICSALCVTCVVFIIWDLIFNVELIFINNCLTHLMYSGVALVAVFYFFLHTPFLYYNYQVLPKSFALCLFFLVHLASTDIAAWFWVAENLVSHRVHIGQEKRVLKQLTNETVQKGKIRENSNCNFGVSFVYESLAEFEPYLGTIVLIFLHMASSVLLCSFVYLHKKYSLYRKSILTTELKNIKYRLSVMKYSAVGIGTGIFVFGVIIALTTDHYIKLSQMKMIEAWFPSETALIILDTVAILFLLALMKISENDSREIQRSIPLEASIFGICIASYYIHNIFSVQITHITKSSNSTQLDRLTGAARIISIMEVSMLALVILTSLKYTSSCFQSVKHYFIHQNCTVYLALYNVALILPMMSKERHDLMDDIEYGESTDGYEAYFNAFAGFIIKSQMVAFRLYSALSLATIWTRGILVSSTESIENKTDTS